MEYQTLANGTKVPLFGLGTWKATGDEIYETVKLAIDIGYRLFDTAYAYQNEKDVGRGINEKIKDGTVSRDELFITTKLWCTHHRRDLVVKQCKESLESLGLDYVDLFLVHFPNAIKEDTGMLCPPKNDVTDVEFSDTHYLECWQGMEDVFRQGLAKAIGVSNFNGEQIKDILNKCEIKPLVSQVEAHPYFPNNKHIKFCNDHGIQVTAYSPFASPDRPPTHVMGNLPVLLEDETPKEVGKKYGKSGAQVMLRWAIQRNTSVIPKSSNPKRLKENFEVLNFKLSDEDMKIIDGMDKNIRYNTHAWWKHDKFWPFSIDY